MVVVDSEDACMRRDSVTKDALRHSHPTRFPTQQALGVLERAGSSLNCNVDWKLSVSSTQHQRYTCMVFCTCTS